MVEIIPAIMPTSLGDLRAHLARVRSVVHTVQIDVMDGAFVPGMTFPYAVGNFENVTTALDDDVDFEIDLMVEDPVRAVEMWVRAGASRVIAHVESGFDADAYFTAAGDAEAGVAISLGTPIERLDPYVARAAFIQCMGIARIGFQGEPFDSRVLSLLVDVHARYPRATLSVDGGVSVANARELARAGASRLVAGSAVFGSADPSRALREIEEAVART